jgi:hypothetical protein
VLVDEHADGDRDRGDDHRHRDRPDHTLSEEDDDVGKAARRLAVHVLVEDAAIGDQRAERREQRRHLQPGDDEAVDEAEQRAAEQRDEDRHRHRHPEPLHRGAGRRHRQAEHRADRKVEIARSPS